MRCVNCEDGPPNCAYCIPEDEAEARWAEEEVAAGRCPGNPAGLHDGVDDWGCCIGCGTVLEPGREPERRERDEEDEWTDR